MNVEELVAFEKEIADSFNSAKIKAPIHLHGDNEWHGVWLLLAKEPKRS